MSLLKTALRANAITSTLSGSVLLIFQKNLTKAFGLTSGTALWILGIGLLLFGGSIIIELKKLRKYAVLWIIIQDILWVVASAYILLAKPFGLTNIAYTLIDIMTFIVLAFAVLQYIGLNKHQKSLLKQ